MSRQPIRVMEVEAIRPAAAPVNTYVRPADPAPSQLHDVAQGLAAFDQGLKGFLDGRREKANEADRIRGEAAFNKSNHLGWAEAVRQGIVPAHASPIFKESYKKSQGNLAGIKLREKYNQAYINWGGRNTDDPAAFDTFFQSFIKENIQTDDPHVLAGLQPHIRQMYEDAYSVRGQEVGKATYNGNLDTQTAIAGESIDYANQDGLSTGDGTNYEGLWGDLVAQRDEVLATGIRKEDYDASLVKAIAAKAIEHQDPKLLDLLDETLPGYDVKLSSLPEFRDIKQNTLEAIEVDIRQRMNDNAKTQKKLDDEAEDKIVKQVYTVLAEDPTAEIPEDIIKHWEKYDPSARVTIARARKSLQEGNELESTETLIQIERMIQDGASPRDILELAANGTITNPATLKSAVDRAEKRRKALLEGNGILKTQTSKRFLSTIKQRTALEQWMEGPFMPDGLTDEGLEATKDFEMMLIQWEEQNANATLFEREKAVNEIGELILSRIEPEFPGKEVPQYISPADAERIRQELEQSEAQAEDPPAEDPTGPDGDAKPQKSDFWRLPEKEEVQKALAIDSGIRIPREADQEARRAWELDQVKQHFMGDQPPNLEDFDRAFKWQIEEYAKALGITPEEYTLDLWKKAKDAVKKVSDPDDSQVETTEGNVTRSTLNQEVEEDISETIETAVISGSTKTAGAASHKDICRTSSLLDLIGHTEGTDKKRRYNETLAYGALTGGDVDLVNMTLGEIDKLQTKMLRHPKNRWNSSALGRYQIVRTTLRKLKKKMGLSDDVKFTPKLQDQMAMILLRGRGMDKWLAGKKSDGSFINGLAREWASLPTTSGKGYYGGQHAGTTVEGLKAALNGVKNYRPDLVNVAQSPRTKPEVSA